MTKAQYASQFRASVNQILDARATMKSLRELDTAEGIVAGITDADLAGTNADLHQADFAAAQAAMDTLEELLTNFAVAPPTPTATAVALLKLRQ
jgi:hypothetical protein